MSAPQTAPYWRLSFFYLVYFASIGTLVPYWSLYLRSAGFSIVEIGEILAVIMATKIVAPNVWGWIADHTGQRIRIIRLGAFLAALVFLGVFFRQDYWWMMFTMFCFSFFWNAGLPQLEALTLGYLADKPHRYSSIRLWGSIGFILAVVAIGAALENIGAEWVPHILLGFLVVIVISSWITPEPQSVPKTLNSPPIWSVICQPAVLALIAVCFLLQASHGPYYAFYSVYMEDTGYSRSAIGVLWALGVVAEIAVFLVMHRLLPKFGARNLMVLAMLVSAFRWWLIGDFANTVSIVIFAQILHAASFGLYHAVAIHLFHQYFPGQLQGRGQALYSSLSFGAGGAVGAFYSGYAWESLGASTTYAIAAALCILAAFISWKWVRERAS